MSDFLQAARFTDRMNPLPHQDAAWNYAWQCLSHDQQAEFLDIFRAAVPSKAEDVSNSWIGITAAAAAAGAKYPELVAAQWALESAWGKSVSGRNNFFGLKSVDDSGTKVKTTEVVDGKTVTIIATFVDFPSVRACVEHLVTRWYLDWGGHQGVNRGVDREEAAQLLVHEGYATDPLYAQKLCALMKDNAPRSRPTQEQVRSQAQIWKTKVEALNLSQPDGSTCQAACIGMAVGDRDIAGIRAQLVNIGKPGSPHVMGRLISTYSNAIYRYECNATLEKVVRWLKDGELLITHGWFTRDGHVIILDGVKTNEDGSVCFDVKDPWSKFNPSVWRYDGNERFFDGYYSAETIYAACVVSQNSAHAAVAYRDHKVDWKAGGMWVHRFQA